jgi:hypothetical protein
MQLFFSVKTKSHKAPWRNLFDGFGDLGTNTITGEKSGTDRSGGGREGSRVWEIAASEGSSQYLRSHTSPHTISLFDWSILHGQIKLRPILLYYILMSRDRFFFFFLCVCKKKNLDQSLLWHHPNYINLFYLI